MDWRASLREQLAVLKSYRNGPAADAAIRRLDREDRGTDAETVCGDWSAHDGDGQPGDGSG